MKIALVCVEDGLMSVGFRKIGAFVRRLNPDTELYYVPVQNYRGLKTILTGRYGECPSVPAEWIRQMAEPLARADLVGFSSMSGYAELTHSLLKEIRRINPKTFLIWGGIHPIMDPDDAVRNADAVCVGEGEFAFERFFAAFQAGRDFLGTENFWFQHGGKIIRNPLLPLMTEAEMAGLPLPNYGSGEQVFLPGKGYRPLTRDDYLEYNGLSYNTVWTIGCPFKCTYCGNTKFIENDAGYRRIRHSGVEYLMSELRQALAVHPHLSTVVFHDDSFMALPPAMLRAFASAYRREIGLPFCVLGVIPNYVTEEKMEILLEAGLNRVRMGIQSGSERILKFYDRPTPLPRVREAVRILNRYSRYMIPPAYDIILDNPVETKEDVRETLRLLYDLPRPYTLNLFSLRSVPNTELNRQMADRGIELDKISANYTHNAPTLANALVYLITVFRPPRRLFELCLRRVKPFSEPQVLRPNALMLCRALYLFRRALGHLRFLDFSVLGGKTGYWLWRLNIIRLWRARLPRFGASAVSSGKADPAAV